MPLVARASKTVRNKNILMLLMCLGFFVVFAYDAFWGYPGVNNLAVAHWKDMIAHGALIPPADAADAWNHELAAWSGWNKANTEQRHQMDAIDEFAKTIRGGDITWHSSFDVQLQVYITYGLAICVIAALWWLIHCQKRRAIAEENTVSPSPGVVIPWEKITIVDNTRWKKSGIVDITYLDAAGQAKKAKFDDYELDREPLLTILDTLAEKSTHAEFIPKEEPSDLPATS